MYVDDAAAAAAFDQLSGEIAASARSALIEGSRFSREAVLDALRQSECGADPRCGAARRTLWGRAYGSAGDLAGGRGAAELDFSARGLVAGADLAAGEEARVGFYAAASRSRFSIDARGSSGRGDNRELGLYGAGAWGGWRLALGAGWTWHDAETRRTVAIPGLAERLDGDLDGRTIQLFGEASYRAGTAAALAEPFAAIAHVDLDVEEATERGGSAALARAGGTTRTTLSLLGLRGRWLTQGPLSAIGLAASAAWRHVLAGALPTATNSFAGGTRFTVAGSALARDAAVVEIGVHAQVTPRIGFNVDYTGQLGSGFRDHGLQGSLSWRF
jgi:outer membrane autotransporter protein